MSHLFRRLPGFTKTPAGAERRVLRLLPRALLWGTLILLLPALAMRVGAIWIESWRSEFFSSMTDIYVASLIVLHWTVVVTVGFAAFIIMVMKGPAYIADGYDLEDADRPDEEESAANKS